MAGPVCLPGKLFARLILGTLTVFFVEIASVPSPFAFFDARGRYAVLVAAFVGVQKAVNSPIPGHAPASVIVGMATGSALGVVALVAVVRRS